MGYYTYYSLDIEPETDKVIAYIEEELADYPYLAWKGDLGRCKWYDHDQSMTNLSEKFPDILFTLHGEGEESLDLWRKYYKGGKSHTVRAVITYEDFSESMLE